MNLIPLETSDSPSIESRTSRRGTPASWLLGLSFVTLLAVAGEVNFVPRSSGLWGRSSLARKLKRNRSS